MAFIRLIRSLRFSFFFSYQKMLAMGTIRIGSVSYGFDSATSRGWLRSSLALAYEFVFMVYRPGYGYTRLVSVFPVFFSEQGRFM